MRKSIGVVMCLALAGTLVLAGCSGQPLTTREKGTLGGTALGAGGGALIGRLCSRQFDPESAKCHRADPAAGAAAAARDRESTRADPTDEVAVGNRVIGPRDQESVTCQRRGSATVLSRSDSFAAFACIMPCSSLRNGQFGAPMRSRILAAWQCRSSLRQPHRCGWISSAPILGRSRNET